MTKERVKIDAIDLKVLEELKKNARTEAKELASRLQISDRTAARRIASLERKGVIRGYTVILNRQLIEDAVPGSATLIGEEIQTTPKEWISLAESLGKLLGSGAVVILQHAGIGIGRGLAEKLWAKDVNRETRCLAIANIFKTKGWGEVGFRNVDFEKAIGVIVLKDNHFGRYTPEFKSPHMVVTGIIIGFLESVFDKKIDMLEVKCVARGDDHCEYIFK